MSTKGWTAVNHSLHRDPNLTDGELRVLIEIMSYQYHKGSEIYPSVETISKNTIRSPRATKYALASLEQKGYIKRRRRFQKTSIIEVQEIARLGTHGQNFAPTDANTANPDEMELPSKGAISVLSTNSALSMVQKIAPKEHLREEEKNKSTPAKSRQQQKPVPRRGDQLEKALADVDLVKLRGEFPPGLVDDTYERFCDRIQATENQYNYRNMTAAMRNWLKRAVKDWRPKPKELTQADIERQEAEYIRQATGGEKYE
jgi:DNA-binding MarR family transcriptional regulator